MGGRAAARILNSLPKASKCSPRGPSSAGIDRLSLMAARAHTIAAQERKAALGAMPRTTTSHFYASAFLTSL